MAGLSYPVSLDNFQEFLPKLCINKAKLDPGHEYYSEAGGTLKSKLKCYADNVTQAPFPSVFLGFDYEKIIVKQPFGRFECYRQIRQCAAASEHDGTVQCQEKTNVLPYCAAHLRSKLKLEIKTSNIINAGDGLFAVGSDLDVKSKPLFKVDDYIADFQGEILSTYAFSKRYGKEYDSTHMDYWFTPYAAKLNKDLVVDAIIVRGVIAVANDIMGSCSNIESELKTNIAPRLSSTGTLQIFATEPIYDGDELFISYGDAYWKAYAYNYK